MEVSTVRPEFIVAAKEFKDNLNSKRFLILFGLLTLLSIIGAITGINSYNSDLATYNSNVNQVSSLPGGMKIFVDMPSILSIFSSYGTYIASFGMLLAISMGFDLISREKEEGTLKILLTHPVFRDQVINGKIIGSAAMMTVVLLSTFLAIVAIMLFFGIVPAGDDLIRLVAFFLAVVLFLLAYLAIAVMSSTLSKSSSMAMLIAIAIVLVGMVIPDVSSAVADAALGQAPRMTIVSTSGSQVSGGQAVTFQVFEGNQNGTGNQSGRQGVPMTINPEYTDYWNKRNQITGIINVISPSNDFDAIAQVITGRLTSPTQGSGGAGFYQRLSGETVSVWDSLSLVWTNFLALIVMIIIGFGVSYAKFVRVDVR
jgi:ABC-2 type transport system permease protein